MKETFLAMNDMNDTQIHKNIAYSISFIQAHEDLIAVTFNIEISFVTMSGIVVNELLYRTATERDADLEKLTDWISRIK